MNNERKLIKTEKYRNINYDIFFAKDRYGDAKLSYFFKENHRNSEYDCAWCTTQVEKEYLNPQTDDYKNMLKIEEKARKAIDLYLKGRDAIILPCNKQHFHNVFGMYADKDGALNKASYDIEFWEEDNFNVKIQFNTTKKFNVELIKAMLKKCGLDPKYLTEKQKDNRYWRSGKDYSHIFLMEGAKFSNVDIIGEIRDKRYKDKNYVSPKAFASKTKSLKWDIRMKKDTLQYSLNKLLEHLGKEYGSYKFELKLVKVDKDAK